MKKNILLSASLLFVSCASSIQHSDFESDRAPAALMCKNLFENGQSHSSTQEPVVDDKAAHDQRLKIEVQKLEDVYKRKLTEVERTSVLVTEVATEITDLKKNMTWSERKLWGGLAKLLGGDPQKIDNMKSRETKKKELESLLDKQRSEAGTSNQAVVKYVSDWLKSVDAKFKEVSQLHEKMNELVCDGNSCISKINSAISDAESATNTERMAQMQMQNQQSTQQNNTQNNPYQMNQPSSSSGMSQLAATHANMARMSSESAQREAQSFVLSLRSLKVKVEASPYFKVNDNSSLAYNTFVMQSVFNYNFNFIGMVNMFNLNNISSNLHSTKMQVEDMNNQLKDQNSLLKEQVENAICKVRSSCQLDL
jgi:hypothetical protein